MDIVFAFSDAGSVDLFPFARNLLTFLVFFYLRDSFHPHNLYCMGSVQKSEREVSETFLLKTHKNGAGQGCAAGQFE
ncbi:MAG: hypothetical protein K6G66_07200 [Oscillospiraceae bacterium]|nr:hypothetical protein [Oscillospiraceae bacterium]